MLTIENLLKWLFLCAILVLAPQAIFLLGRLQTTILTLFVFDSLKGWKPAGTRGDIFQTQTHEYPWVPTTHFQLCVAQW